MKYRRIAMDLDPNKPRFVPGRNNTAGQDWYILYVETAFLRRRLESRKKQCRQLSQNQRFQGHTYNT